MIKTEDLTFSYYKGETEKVLDKLNMEIHKGSFVALLGANGSGKSTLAKHFNGINLPMGGKVYVEKMDTTNEMLLFNIRQTVGMVFQNPDNQIVATTVEDDVAFAPENMGVPRDEIRKRIDWAMKVTGVDGFKDRAPHTLSGGQKQRVAIAGILAMRPKYIILDEPTAMLDPIGRKEVVQTLRKLNTDLGITIVIITHNMDEAVLADQAIVLNGGKITMKGTPEEIFGNTEKIKEAGLDVPQVTELIYQLKKRGFPITENAFTVDRAYEILKPFANKGTFVKGEAFAEKGEKIIDVKNVTYEYSTDGPYYKKALDNVSLEINKGDYIGIIGHTGSGKSTLLQHLNALIKPTDGEIIVDGINTKDKKADLKRVRTKVGLVFQYPEYQLFEETVEKDIAFSPKNMGLSEDEILDRVKFACDVIGVEDKWLVKSPFELSGGQKRRVAMAGVIAMKPDVLILDEPTAGLDPRGKKYILDKIEAMHSQYGITVVLVSHDMEEVAKRAKRILVLNEGKIFADGTPNQVFSNYEELEKIGLTAPQITHLTDKLFGIKACTVLEALELFDNLGGGDVNA